jgi:hypothetical protein
MRTSAPFMVKFYPSFYDLDLSMSGPDAQATIELKDLRPPQHG